MKNFKTILPFLVLLIGVQANIFAQSAIDSNAIDTVSVDYFRQLNAQKYGRIATDSLQTGIFLEKTLLSDALNSYNLDDTTSVDQLYSAVVEFELQSIAGQQSFAGAKSKLDLLSAKYAGSDTNCLVVLDAVFDYLDTVALDSGLIRISSDSLYESAPNVHRNPFKQGKHAWFGLMGPIRKNQATGKILIKFDGTGLISNSTQTIIAVTLTIGAAQYTINRGETIALPVSGNHFFANATIHYQSGATVGPIVSYSVVQNDTSAEDWNTYYPAECTELFTGSYNVDMGTYPAPPSGKTVGYLGKVYNQSQSDVGALLANFYPAINRPTPATCFGQQGIFSKPILISDGIDFQNSRQQGELYGSYLRYWSFRDNEPKFLGRELRLQGFDIIIADYPDFTLKNEYEAGLSDAEKLALKKDHGCGLVEHNAMAFVSLIQRINQGLPVRADGTRDAITVVGASMGGLVTRFALAYMEKKEKEYLDAGNQTEAAKWKHNCKLWISFDSPHLGANLPIGGQQFLKFFGQTHKGENTSAAEWNYKFSIGSLAAQQLLLDHVYKLPSFGNDPAPAEARNIFMRHMLANGKPNAQSLIDGFPQDCRKVALVDGSFDGLNIKKNDGTRMVGGEVLTSMTAALRFSITRHSNALNRLFRFVNRSITQNSEFITAASATIKAAPQSSSNSEEIFKGYFALAGPHRSKVDANNFSSSVGRSIDACPGGMFSLIETISKSTGVSGALFPNWKNNNIFENKKLEWDLRRAVQTGASVAGLLIGGNFLALAGSFATIADIQQRTSYAPVEKYHSFIPTKSALAFRAGLVNIGETLSDRNLVCTNEIPFDDYIGCETDNSFHIQLNEKMYDFIIRHLQSNSTTPLPVEIYTNILGPERICGNQTGNFSINIGQRYLNGGIPFTTNYTNFDPLIPLPASQTEPLQTVLKAPYGIDGEIDLHAETAVQINNHTCLFRATQLVKYGPPPIGYISRSKFFLYLGISPPDEVNLASPIIDGATSYNWTISSTGNSFIELEQFSTHPSTTTPNTARVIPTTAPLPSSAYSYPHIELTVPATCGIHRGWFQLPVFRQHGLIVPNPSFGSLGNTQVLTVNVSHPGDGNSLPLVTNAVLLDARGDIVAKPDILGNNTFQFGVSNLASSAYRVVVYFDDGTKQDIDWIMKGEEESSIIVSPNPAVYQYDNVLQGLILDTSTGKSYDVTLSDQNGVQLQTTSTSNLEFTFDATLLQPGLYTVLAQDKATGVSHTEMVEVGLKDAPRIVLATNPLVSTIVGTLVGALEATKELTYKILDQSGQQRKAGTLAREEDTNPDGTANISTGFRFQIPCPELLNALYVLVVSDSRKSFSISFLKQ